MNRFPKFITELSNAVLRGLEAAVAATLPRSHSLPCQKSLWRYCRTRANTNRYCRTRASTIVPLCTITIMWSIFSMGVQYSGYYNTSLFREFFKLTTAAHFPTYMDKGGGNGREDLRRPKSSVICVKNTIKRISFSTLVFFPKFGKKW